MESALKLDPLLFFCCLVFLSTAFGDDIPFLIILQFNIKIFCIIVRNKCNIFPSNLNGTVVFYPYCQIISIIFLKIIICTWSRGRSLRWRIRWDSFAEDKHLRFFATNSYNHCACCICRAFFFCLFQRRKSKLFKYSFLFAEPIRLKLPFSSKCFLNLFCRDKMFDITINFLDTYDIYL